MRILTYRPTGRERAGLVGTELEREVEVETDGRHSETLWVPVGTLDSSPLQLGERTDGFPSAALMAARIVSTVSVEFDR